MRPPGGLLIATTTVLALAWGVYLLDTRAWPGIALPVGLSVLYLVNLVLTMRSRRAKIVIVRAIQRWLINPVVWGLMAVGLNPLGLAILETRGRVTGQPRRTPVGNGRVGQDFWIIAEHGTQAGYVRNIRHDPRVRLRLRIGWRYQWVTGIAELLPEDDALARQRRIVRWHPLRALNALAVRLLGADLLTVRVRLLPADDGAPTPDGDEAAAVNHHSRRSISV
jgi:deazaflavin-dependent oxidoreductase (nitroreductase family)